MRKRFKKAMSLVLSAAMAMSLVSGVSYSPTSAAEGDDAGTEAAEAASYKAIVGFQISDSYDYREFSDLTKWQNYNADLDKTAEDAYKEWLTEQGEDVSEYPNPGIYSTGPELKRDGTLKSPEKVEICTATEIVDAKMTEDGEYTVSISGLNISTSEAERFFNMLYVGTNIPVNEANANAKLTASSVKLNGEEIAKAKDVVLPHKADVTTNYQFMIANTYAPGDKTEGCLYYGKRDDGEVLDVPEGPLDIEISFKIEGVDWSSVGTPVTVPSEEPATPAPEVTLSPKASVAPFDIYISSNVNNALSPDEGVIGKDGKAIQAGVFASKEVKAKIDAAKDSKGEPVFKADETTYFETETASATISETGAYTLTVTARGDCDDMAASGAIWLPVLINGSPCNMPTDFNLVGKEISVVATGAAAETKTYNWPSRLMQDAEKNVRLSVCNQWATKTETAMANPIKDQISIKKGDVISFTFYVIAEAPAPMPTATPSAISTKAATSYNGYLGFQTDNWTFRNEFNNEDYGLNSKYVDYKNEVGYWDAGVSPKPADDKQCARQKVAITDTTITDNNVEYTASIKGLNLQTLKGTDPKDVVSKHFKMLFISTDIPLSMQGVTMKNATLKIDGAEVQKYTVVPCKGDASDYYQFMLANAYAPSDGTKDAAYPSGNELTVLPTDSIEISYTMEGVDFDRHDVGPAKGETFSVGDFKYKVTKAAVQSGDKEPEKGAVQVVGLSKKGKKKASVSLGATTKVTSAGAIAAGATTSAVATYKITTMKKKAFAGSSKLKKFNAKKATNVKALSAGAFTNCKKLTSVVLGKKMNKIPAAAFKGCKKLSSITCNAKLKSVNKSAFKGCKKKIKIAGKSKAANKKKIKKVYKKVK